MHLEILSSKFRILQSNIALSPDKVEKIVLACCVLHNMMRRESSSYLCNEMVDNEDVSQSTISQGSWRRETQPIGLERSLGRPSNGGIDVRKPINALFL